MAEVKVKYDPAVIQEFAPRLYTQAKYLVWTWGIRFGVLGFIVGMGGSAALAGGRVTTAVPGVIVGLVGVLLGASYGREKGFELRLKAQESLCLLETEMNTRSRRNAAESGGQL